MASIIKKEYQLDSKGIDEIIAEMNSWMNEHKIQNSNRIKCSFSMETVLMDLMEHFQGELQVETIMRKKFGDYYFSITYDGEVYNPLNKVSSDEFTGYMLNKVGLKPSWSYKNKTNELDMKIPHNPASDEMLLLTSVLLAVLIGLMRPLFTDSVATYMIANILTPVSDIFMHLMGVFAGFMIFFSVVSGIGGIGSVAEFSKMGRLLIVRAIALTFLGCGMAVMVMIPLFGFHYGKVKTGSEGSTIIKMIFDLLPTNPISPFMDGNMIHIVFIAVIVGVIMLKMGREVKDLQNVVIQANSVMLKIVYMICKLLPLYIITSLVILFWENGLGFVKTLWKPIVLCIVVCFGMVAAKILLVSVKCKVSPFFLIKAVLPSFLVGLTTASSLAAFGTVMDINEKRLGISSEFNNFAIPITNIIYNSSGAAGYMVIIFYLAKYSGVDVNAIWFFTAWFIVSVLSLAIPPISGGVLVVIGIMLAQLGIPKECLGIAGTLVLIQDFFMTSSIIVLSQMEHLLEANRWKLVDYNVLHGKNDKALRGNN